MTDDALPSSPCDGCPWAKRCAAEQLACTAFWGFVLGRDWKVLPRVDATAERFEGVMNALKEPPDKRRRRYLVGNAMMLHAMKLVAHGQIP